MPCNHANKVMLDKVGGDFSLVSAKVASSNTRGEGALLAMICGINHWQVKSSRKAQGPFWNQLSKGMMPAAFQEPLLFLCSETILDVVKSLQSLP